MNLENIFLAKVDSGHSAVFSEANGKGTLYLGLKESQPLNLGKSGSVRRLEVGIR